MRQRWGVIGLVAVISFLSGGWLLQRGVASDGNVYQHTDSGWSKWNNGGWSPVQPPSNSGSRTQPTSQRTSGTSNVGGTQYGSHPSSTDRSSYQQLEQDRLGREAGEGRYSGRYGSGGGSGGGRFEGGGRFRR